jgi:hypothetical protein
MSPQTTVKQPDLIVEFTESRGEKFLIPREITSCEQEICQESPERDIVLYTFVPFLNDEAAFQRAKKEHRKSSTPTVIRLRNATYSLWECIKGWVNEDAKILEAWHVFSDKVMYRWNRH